MRTTLSLDDDVAALLERARKRRKTGLKETVNEALRRGLREMTAAAPRRELYHTPSISLGRCLVGSLDDVEEVLAITEGDELS